LACPSEAAAAMPAGVQMRAPVFKEHFAAVRL